MRRASRTPEPEAFEPPSSARAVLNDDTALDWADVPAAVVCAFCGRPDCAGCIDVDEPTNASGVVAIVPWERAGIGWVRRLWGTARLATLSHHELFSALPEGGWRAPLRFAILAELCAATGLGICSLGLFAMAPDFARTVLNDAILRAMFLRAVALGVPGLTCLMLVLHALHGLLVDRAARLVGSRKRGRGLRFGLYACGWDLVTLPFGLIVVACTEGLSAARRAGGLAISIPSQATRAYLTGVHALDPMRARKAGRRANAETGLSALGLLILAAATIAWLGR